MKWERVQIQWPIGSAVSQEKFELNGKGRMFRTNNKRVQAWRLKSGATLFKIKKLNKEKREIEFYQFLISDQTLSEMVSCHVALMQDISRHE